MNETIKLVITGYLGAGKTTTIRTVTEIPMISTHVQNNNLSAPIIHELSLSQDNKKVKNQSREDITTVTLDYGELTLETGQILKLYATAGHYRLDCISNTLTEQSIGLIILVNNNGDDPIGDLARHIDHFFHLIQAHKVVIGVTHTDQAPLPKLQLYENYLKARDLALPLFSIDARSHNDVILLIQTLLTTLK